MNIPEKIDLLIQRMKECAEHPCPLLAPYHQNCMGGIICDAAAVIETQQKLITVLEAEIAAFKNIVEVPPVSIDVLDLSVRSYHLLKTAHVNTISDLVVESNNDFANVPNMTEMNRKEIIGKLNAFVSQRMNKLNDL